MKAVKEIQKLREKREVSCGQTSLWFGKGAGRILFEDGWTFVWIRSSRGTFVRWWYGPEDEVLRDSGFKDRRPPFKGLRAYERWLSRVVATQKALEKEADYLSSIQKEAVEAIRALPDSYRATLKAPNGVVREFSKQDFLRFYDRYWLEASGLFPEMLMQIGEPWAKNLAELERRRGRYKAAVQQRDPQARREIYEDWKAEVCA